ncbi:hypothetical protein [Caballeronia sp. Sq4a]|uniref:hypothetical protein n=1 Tax=Caballeronia sp. Sq4a TaxID=2878152 RepID=UPI0020BE889B|nr:hypothetical protein [Caballeronia sp. Sq4a]
MLAWQGFLWSARLYRPLLSAVKQSFLDTANHYERLGQGKAQYAAMLAFAALEPEETFTISELQTATRALPPSGLAETTRALVRALESAGERREEYWTHRVRPYLRRIWPKTRDIASQMISEQFARLAIGAGEQFPEALASVLDWLQPLEHPFYTVHLVCQAGLSARFPREALQLLNAMMDAEAWASSELRACLEQIREALPVVETDERFRRLWLQSRQPR